MRRTDVHQHLSPEQLLAELSRRDRAPLVRKSGRRYRLVLDGEPDYLFDLAQHDPDVRRSELAAAGIERALITPSLPLGIESLPFDEAAPLIDAHHDGVLSLGGWAPTRSSRAPASSSATRSPTPRSSARSVPSSRAHP